MDKAGPNPGDEVAVTLSAPANAGIGASTDRVYGSRTKLYRHVPGSLQALGDGWIPFDRQAHPGGAQVAFGVFDDVTVFTTIGGSFAGGSPAMSPRADGALAGIAQHVEALPDGSDPAAGSSCWKSADARRAAVGALESLRRDLPALAGAAASARLSAIRGLLAAGVTNASVLAVLFEQVDSIARPYDDGRLPLGATVATYDLGPGLDGLGRGPAHTDLLRPGEAGSIDWGVKALTGPVPRRSWGRRCARSVPSRRAAPPSTR